MKKALLLVLALMVAFSFTGCKKNGKKKEKEKTDFEIADTTWVSNMGDEFLFLENEVKLSRDNINGSDSYFFGEYKLLIGDDAMDYLNDELEVYNVSEEEIKELIDNNEKYSEENFVVFDIRYIYGVDGDVKFEMDGALIPWYGFVIDEGTRMDIMNMNSNSTMTLIKQK